MEKELFELMTKMYSEMHEMKQELKQDIFDAKQELKQDIVRLENKMDEKLSALFDAREVQIDVDEQVAHNLQRVETKVDKLELKVLRNNLNLPSTKEQ